MRTPSKRILVTRSPHQASTLAELLRGHGLEPILIPTIEIAEPSTFEPLDASLAQLDSFHWLLFTSANAVEAFHRRLVVPSRRAQLRDGHNVAKVGELPQGLKIAGIGPTTATALAVMSREANLLPPQAVAESFAAALLPHAFQADGTPTRFLLIRAEIARDHLPETLRTAGADVTIAMAYRTITPADSIPQIRQLFSDPARYPDAITFTSSSTARNLFDLLEAAGLSLPPSILRASMGPITSQTLRALGFPPHAESPVATMSALVETLTQLLA